MASVRFEHINKSFGKVEVVHDLNLTVNDHELVVLVGPSGSGKSTILRMVAGLDEPSGGNLYIGDRLVNGVEPKDRDIAMVFQSYALYPQMSVSDNMAFSLQMHHVPKKEREEQVQQAARMLGLQEYLQRKPKALSGGQRPGCPGTRDRARAGGLSDGRAALQPGCAVTRGHPGRDY